MRDEIMTMENNQETAPEITVKDGCYCFHDAEITNFVVESSSTVIGEETTDLCLKLRTKGGELVKVNMPTSAFSSVSTLKQELNRNSLALAYMASGVVHEKLKEYIWNNIDKKIQGVKASGIYFRRSGHVYVENDRAVDEEGNKVDDICQLAGSVGIKSEILKYSAAGKEELKGLVNCLFAHNENGIAVSILAWICAAFLKTHLRWNQHKLPHLCIAGEAGSGKSTVLEQIILPVFSLDTARVAGQLTNFSSLKDASSSRLVPMVIDEYKPSSMKNTSNIHNFMRSAYDGHESQRGRPDQTVSRYRLDCPVVLSGESSPNEAAIRERTILCMFTKNKKEMYVKAMNILKNNEFNVHRLGRLFLNKALKYSPEAVEDSYKEAFSKCGDRFPERVKNNISCLYSGLDFLKYVLKESGLSLSDVTAFSMDQMLDIIMNTMQENLLDGRETNKSVIDETLEIMARMGLVKDQEYRIKDLDGRKVICIRFNQVYDKFTRYKTTHNIPGEVLSKSEFERQLKRSEYFIDSNRNVKFPNLGGKDKKCWILDFELLSSRCDVSGFEDGDGPVATSFGIPSVSN